MSHYKPVDGQRFGRLLAIRKVETSSSGNALIECKCDCGKIVIVKRTNLVHEQTKSCGCLKKRMGQKIRCKIWERKW